MRLIDADALVFSRVRIAHEDGTIGGYNAVVMSSVINNAPTIDAVPVRHGKFIGTEYDGYADGNPVYYEWKCSECGCVFEDDEPTFNYCPNCGARMDEE